LKVEIIFHFAYTLIFLDIIIGFLTEEMENIVAMDHSVDRGQKFRRSIKYKVCHLFCYYYELNVILTTTVIISQWCCWYGICIL